MPELILELTGEAGIRPEEIDHIVLHQANQRIIEAVARRLNLKDSISGEFGQICKYFGSFDPCFVG